MGHITLTDSGVPGELARSVRQQWVADLGASLAPATVAKCYGVLLMVLRTAVRARLIAHNPADGIRVGGRSATDGTPCASTISREEFAVKLLPALPREHRTIVCTAAGAGLRWGECAGLAWSSVDLQAGLIAVRHVAVETPGTVTVRPYPKTRAGIRRVPMPAFLTQALTAHRPHPKPAGNALVFPSETCGTRTPPGSSATACRSTWSSG